jgi:hypothetical protein
MEPTTIFLRLGNFVLVFRLDNSGGLHMFLIDMQNKKAVSLDRKSFSELKLSERNDLQEWIAGNPQILGENLLIIQKEFDGFSDTNERLDLLAIDEGGRLVVIENKLDDSGKDVVWQALKYVSYCATLTKGEICEIYQRYLESIGSSGVASERIADFFDEQDYESIRLNPSDGDQRIILVAANFRKEVTSTVLWLCNHGVEIKCIKVTPYKDGDRLYLDAEQILPIQDTDDYQIRLTAKKREEKEEALRYKVRYRFWGKALPFLREKTSMFTNASPSRDSWLNGVSRHKGITFNPIVKFKGARAEMMILTKDKERNKSVFHALKDKKDEIERAFGGVLDWQELPDKKGSRICVHFQNYGLYDEEHWDEISNFLADNLAKLITTFEPHLDSVVKG